MCNNGGNGSYCVETIEGTFECKGCNDTKAVELYHRAILNETFDGDSLDNWVVYTGKFGASNHQMTGTGEGLAIVSKLKLADFIYEADITFSNAMGESHAGLVFRTDSDTDGRGVHSGYYASISSAGVVRLSRGFNETRAEIKSAVASIQAGRTYRVRVQAMNDTILVYLDDMRTPKLRATDSSASQGFPGVHMYDTEATFGNISILPMVRQAGIEEGCTEFHRAVAGDSCAAIVQKYPNLSAENL